MRLRGTGWLLLPAALAAGFVLCAPVAAEPEHSNSSTVLGVNALLADGAAAMSNGEWQRGIELTQMGMSATISREEQAIGLANLCAAHAALQQFRTALEFCDQSLSLQDTNWRTWQNRAACHLGLGQIEESLRDLQRGLAINPDSDALQKTLDIARAREKQEQQRVRQLLES
jgi:tetratricopeptide (TPR) repeat protein